MTGGQKTAHFDLLYRFTEIISARGLGHRSLRGNTRFFVSLRWRPIVSLFHAVSLTGFKETAPIMQLSADQQLYRI
jgi:hypothetical protein